MYDLIVSLSPLFDNFVEDLDFPCSTNLFGFEEITGAELAAFGEIIEAAEDAALTVYYNMTKLMNKLLIP